MWLCELFFLNSANLICRGTEISKYFRESTVYIWAVPCKNVSSDICGQQRPRSACVSVQFDQDLRCPQTESLDTTEMPGWYFAHAQDDINLRVFEGIFARIRRHFLLDAAHLTFPQQLPLYNSPFWVFPRIAVVDRLKDIIFFFFFFFFYTRQKVKCLML